MESGLARRCAPARVCPVLCGKLSRHLWTKFFARRAPLVTRRSRLRKMDSGGAIRHLLRSGWQLDRYYESHRSRQAAHAASAPLGKRCGAADFECHMGPVAPSTPTAESVLVVVGRVAAKAAEYDVLQTLVASNSASLFQTRRDWRNGWLKRERAVENGIVGPQDRPTEHNVRASAGPWQPTPLSSQRGG